ncbi:sodium:solute symporter family transporter [Natrarchaeobius oligotrophus]|uniref:Sodium:solute symporter n=1 Tax=Natrarchaeobius chitinivorans TaxID=1679083 RepID=A0A3N6M291_NATCH|nr:hypothetical protein [Natrarchaeobius chitinivorans]RQG97498.1 hypothetical protein EA472_19255 [Natrarchaeobius chitinivorans]
MSLPWINIGIVVVLGVLFILAGLYFSRKVSAADEYIVGSGKLGVAFGMTSLLAFWITGNTMLAAPESAFNWGITGALAYGFGGGIAVVIFGLFSKRIHQVIPHGKTVGDYYGRRFDSKNYYLFISLLIVYVIGLIVTQGIGGGVLLEQVFDIPYYLSVMLTFGVVIAYSYYGGFRSVAGVAYFQVLLILVVAIVIPPLVYFNVGFAPTYNGMAELAPERLDLLNETALLFMFAGAVFLIGEVFMDNTFWQRAYAIRREDVVKTFLLSGIGWMLVPLAVASLAFVAIGFGEEPVHPNQVAPLVAQIYGGDAAGWLFLVAVWTALASTTAASINALATLLMNDLVPRVKDDRPSDNELLQYGKYLTIVVGLAGLLFSLPQILTMLEMLIFLGVINAAFVFPIVLGLWWEKTNPDVVFAAVISATVVGYAVYFTIGDLQGIVASGWISFIVTFVGSLLQPSTFDWRQLHDAGTRYEEVSD